jgi:diadenosine tetraphosphate (Ap4A) HIT family hydrolase
MVTQSQEWMERERWDALVRGDGCPACLEVASSERADEYGYVVTDLEISRLRLAANQYVSGYCVLLCHRHVREPYELSQRDRARFFEDMTRVGSALDQVFHPLKMNFNILGNAIPHLHAHILPRYYGDPAPHRPIDPGAGQVLLTPDEYQNRIDLIRAALGQS